MTTFSFVVEIAPTERVDRDRFEDALYEAGCNDALIVFLNEKMLLDFDREAASYDQAVATARADIERAGWKVMGVEPSDD